MSGSQVVTECFMLPLQVTTTPGRTAETLAEALIAEWAG